MIKSQPGYFLFQLLTQFAYNIYIYCCITAGREIFSSLQRNSMHVVVKSLPYYNIEVAQRAEQTTKRNYASSRRGVDRNCKGCDDGYTFAGTEG